MHADELGNIPATFQIIYMVNAIPPLCSFFNSILISSPLQIGWKPAPSQPKPLDRGTGKVNLKDVL
jgi:NADH dehydrogenase [ubiquinone] 1 alpha subcomplex assembly factor 5